MMLGWLAGFLLAPVHSQAAVPAFAAPDLTAGVHHLSLPAAAFMPETQLSPTKITVAT